MPIDRDPGSEGKVRYGIVALSCAVGEQDNAVYFIQTIGHDPTMNLIGDLYGGGQDPAMLRQTMFTEDPSRVTSVLASLEPKGDEDMLLALDLAADFPFGPLSNTKRVIALFSDEPFEGGIAGSEPVSKMSQLQAKLMARHIKLFAAVPRSPAALDLAQTDGSEIVEIDGGDGLRDVDFAKLLGQMGKSISVSALQAVSDRISPGPCWRGVARHSQFQNPILN